MKVFKNIKLLFVIFTFCTVGVAYSQTTFTITNVNSSGIGSSTDVFAQAILAANAGNNVIVYMNAPGLCSPPTNRLIDHQAGSITIEKDPLTNVEQGFYTPDVNAPETPLTIISTHKVTLKNITLKNFKYPFSLYRGKVVFDHLKFENYLKAIYVGTYIGSTVEELEVLDCTFENLNPPNSTSGYWILERLNQNATYSSSAVNNHFYFKRNTIINLPNGFPVLNFYTSVGQDKVDIQIDNNQSGRFGLNLGQQNSQTLIPDYLFSANIHHNKLAYAYLNSPCTNWLFNYNEIDASGYGLYLVVDYNVSGVNDFSMNNQILSPINSNNTYYPHPFILGPGTPSFIFSEQFNGNQELNNVIEIVGQDFPGAIIKSSNVSIRRCKIYSSTGVDHPIYSDYYPGLNITAQLDLSNPSQAMLQLDYNFSSLLADEVNDEKHIDLYKTNSNGDILDNIGSINIPSYSGLQNNTTYNNTIAIPSAISLGVNDRIVATVTSLLGPSPKIPLGTSEASYITITQNPCTCGDNIVRIGATVAGPGALPECLEGHNDVCIGKDFTLTLSTLGTFFATCPINTYTLITVDWGDGTTDSHAITDLTFTHNYSTANLISTPKVILHKAGCPPLEKSPGLYVHDCCCTRFTDRPGGPEISNMGQIQSNVGDYLNIKGFCNRDLCQPLPYPYELTFTWTIDGTIVYNGDELNHQFLTSGNHTVAYSITNADNSCNSSGSFSVEVPDNTPPCQDCYSEYQTQYACNSPRSEAGCGNYVVYVSDAVYQNRANVIFDYNLSLKDQNQNATLVSEVSDGANNNFNSNFTPNSHPNFTYLGPVIIPASILGGTAKTIHAYRFNHAPISFINGTIAVFNFQVYEFNAAHTTATYLPEFNTEMYQRKCGECPRCPSRMLMVDLDKNYANMSYLLGVQPNLIGAAGSITHNDFQNLKINFLKYDLGIENAPPSLVEYNDATTPSSIGNVASIPSSICSNSPVAEVECSCYSGIVGKLVEIAEQIRDAADLVVFAAEIAQFKRDLFYGGCSCLNKYCMRISIPDRGNPFEINVDLYPYLQTGLPAYSMLVVKSLYDPNQFRYKICYSNSYQGQEFPSGVTRGSHNSLVCAPDFMDVDVNSISNYPSCQIPCADCIADFAPLPGQKYIVSVWAKEENSTNPTNYTNPQLIIEELDGANNVITNQTFIPSGKVIDGWQKIDGEYQIPASTTKIRIRLKSLNGNCYFDDIRFFPKDGSMKSYVYDPITLRLNAELDERNYATIYEYDEEGKLVRVKKETEKGVMTIQENRSNTKKK